MTSMVEDVENNSDTYIQVMYKHMFTAIIGLTINKTPSTTWLKGFGDSVGGVESVGHKGLIGCRLSELFCAFSVFLCTPDAANNTR